MKNTSRAAVALFGLLSFATASHAIPVGYTFQTGGAIPVGPSPELASLFTGLTVSGAFKYDSEAPFFGEDPVFTAYSGALLDLNGAVGAWSFSDPSGLGAVADDSLPIPPPVGPLDAFMLSAATSTPYEPIFSGFSLPGLTLFNVRLYWTQTPITPEIVTSSSLLDSLPTFAGTLALDFLNESGQLSSAFFGGLIVTPQPSVSVPEPGAAGLFALALLVCGLAGRRRSS